ncbi:MAG: heme o synthase [Gammaproteobacteria bacterium]|jgi:protoheme IX farnesyltransferase
MNLWRDYLQLTKPKVVLLMLITALVGMQLATPGVIPLHILFFGLTGIGLAAACAAVLNHVVDLKKDKIMKRTLNRPIPQERISPRNALIFAVILGVLSMVILCVYVNPLTAVLSLFSLIGYAFFYTVILKRLTPQNIVIGGLAGAMPPLLGWTALTGEINAHALLLVLIIFIWTPPHFWSLAIHRRDDYAKAQIPMLPVTHGIDFTALCILLYTILLLPITLLPYLVGMSGLIYLIGILILDIIFIVYAVLLKYRPQPLSAIKTFHFSNIYLCLLFALLLVDHFLKGTL